MKFSIYVVGAIMAIVAAHFIIRWIEKLFNGDYIAELPLKEIGSQLDSNKSAPIDIEASVVTA